MICTKCNGDMSWLRTKTISRKIRYCPTCGYSFKRSILGRVTENPIYGIGTINHTEQIAILMTKNDYETFGSKMKFIPLINSLNIKKDVQK